MKARDIRDRVLDIQGKGSENRSEATGNGMEIIGYIQEIVRSTINQATDVKEKEEGINSKSFPDEGDE